MATKHNCAGKTWGRLSRVGGRVYQCTRNATVECDGKWWCWQHAPEHVKAKAIKRMTTWQAEQDRLDARYIRNTRLAALVTEELAELLERLAAGARVLASRCPIAERGLASLWRGDAETGLARAARIREALALEGDDAKR